MTNIDPEQTSNVIIIKGRFKSMNLYGQLIIIFNCARNIESFNIVASSYSEVYNLEPHTEWDKFEEFIADIKWKGNFSNTLTVSLMNHFTSYCDDHNSVQILYKNAYDYDYDNLELILSDQINRIVHDKNLILESVIQEITIDEYASTKENRNKPKVSDEKNSVSDDENENNKDEKPSVILSVKPILAPVKGTPVYALRIGDKIMIKIPPSSDYANYIIDLLELRQGTQIGPAIAKVIDIKAGKDRKDPIEILTEISRGIYGKFFEDQKQVKLKIYDPAENGFADGNTNPYQSDDKTVFSRGIILMMVLFIIILTLFIFLIFLSW